MKRFYQGMGVAGLLAGCAATTANFYPHEIREAENVMAYPATVTPPALSLIHEIQSNSCDSNASLRFPNTRGESLWLLKLRTIRLGGDVVVDFRCHKESYDLVSRCRESLRCEGKAARLVKPAGQH